MEREYGFLTSCVGLNGVEHAAADLWDMIDPAREIAWTTFRRHVPVKEVRDTFPFYSYRQEHFNPDTGEMTVGLHIKDDRNVSFWKSKFRGKPCYYIDHSSIEYIWTRVSQ